MVGEGIKVTCKQCGKQANANEFVLDYYYKMMVCPNCVKERRNADRKALDDVKINDTEPFAISAESGI